MVSDIIDFAKAKADADKSRSAHFVSLDVYFNSDNSEVWASVANVGENDLDASWHTFVADTLRRLAWISDNIAADMDSTLGRPVANIAIFEDARISTRWNDEVVETPDQLDWIRNQAQSGIDEIEAELKGHENE